MKPFAANMFFMIGRLLGELSEQHKSSAEFLDKKFDPYPSVFDVLDSFSKSCEEVSLLVSGDLMKNLQNDLRSETGLTYRELSSALHHIAVTITVEMRRTLFMYMPAERAAFYSAKELFGKEVNDKFLTIQFDVTEAGNAMPQAEERLASFILCA